MFQQLGTLRFTVTSVSLSKLPFIFVYRIALVVVDMGCPVEDARWSPYSSTVFSCMQTKGRIAVYDLGIRLYKPLCSQRVVAQRRSKLSCMTFSVHHPVILIGDDRGHVSCLKLSPNLRKITPVPETARAIDIEVAKLERIVRLMKYETEKKSVSVLNGKPKTQ